MSRVMHDELVAHIRQGVGAHGYLLVGEAAAARAFFDAITRSLNIHEADRIVIEGDSLAVGDIRQFITRLLVRPFASTHKLAFITGALNEESQASLLKIIEEPPRATIIFCSVRHRDDIAATLRSRLETIRLEAAAGPEAQAWPHLAELATMPLSQKLKFAAEAATGGQVQAVINAFMLELRAQVYYDIATQEKLRVCLDASRELTSNVNARLLLENLILTIT